MRRSRKTLAEYEEEGLPGQGEAFQLKRDEIDSSNERKLGEICIMSLIARGRRLGSVEWSTMGVLRSAG